MDPITTLREYVTVESTPLELPSTPAKSVPRIYPGAPQSSDSIELHRIDTNRENEEAQHIEMSPPGSPVSPSDPVEMLPSVWDPHKNRYRFLSTCLMNFQNGMNDSAPGALIPYMEKHYNIGYALISLIFVGNAFGFIFGAAILDILRTRLTKAQTYVLSQSLIALAYIPIVATAPFPLIVVSFFLTGFGMSLNLAMSNIFCGGMRNGTTALGCLHGAYGIGGTIGPLIATGIVAVAGAVWSRFYFLTLGLTVVNAGFAAWSFGGYETELTGGQQEQRTTSPSARENVASMFTAISSRVVLLGALFIFAYQGAEVSISGWVISFLIAARHGDPSSVGYVTAGFWGGITLGRFLLSAPAHKIGEKRFVYACVVGAACFQLLVWWVPNVVGDAVAVAIVGLLLGPVYPCAAAVFMRQMNRSEQVSGMGVISAFGSSGGAAAPFTTGILAQAVGTFVLHPIAIALFAVMIGCWYGLPSRPKRSE